MAISESIVQQMESVPDSEAQRIWHENESAELVGQDAEKKISDDNKARLAKLPYTAGILKVFEGGKKDIVPSNQEQK